MHWLKRLLGRDDRFYDLLEAAAEEAKASVDIFARYLQALAQNGSAADAGELIHTRRKEKRIRQQMTEALSRTFVTPLDREDIEALSFALYRIPKQVEKIVERISIYPGRVPLDGFRRQAELMLQAADAVITMVKLLRTHAGMGKIRETNERLQFAEGEADKLMLSLLKSLYNGDASARELVILGEIYEMVEAAVDRCRNAGNIVVQIALKHT